MVKVITVWRVLRRRVRVLLSRANIVTQSWAIGAGEGASRREDKKIQFKRSDTFP